MKTGVSPPENLNVTSIETDELVAQQISSFPEHWLIDTGQNIVSQQELEQNTIKKQLALWKSTLQ